jgi:hypothetical protein
MDMDMINALYNEPHAESILGAKKVIYRATDATQRKPQIS